MQFQPINPASAMPLTSGLQSGLGLSNELFKAMQQGAMAKYAQPMAQQQLQQQQLATQIAQAQAKYAEPTAQADAAYKLAMAKYLGSPAKQEQGLTQLGKTYYEKAFFGGQNPTIMNKDTGNPIPNPNYMPQIPETGDPIQDKYNLLQQKLTTDSQARQRNLFASNIEKTLEYINPDVLGQYSGFKGKGEELFQKIQAGRGKESEDYDKFVKTLKAADFLTKQVRSFYGDSIQPEMQENLKKILNPDSWLSNPKLTKETFNQTKEILQKELGTYRQAMKSTKPYEGQNDLGLRMQGNPEALKTALGNRTLPGGIRQYNPQTGRIE